MHKQLTKICHFKLDTKWQGKSAPYYHLQKYYSFHISANSSGSSGLDSSCIFLLVFALTFFANFPAFFFLSNARIWKHKNEKHNAQLLRRNRNDKRKRKKKVSNTRGQDKRSTNTWFGDMKYGFSYRVGPPKLPANILIGFKQNRGPTYTQVYSEFNYYHKYLIKHH